MGEQASTPPGIEAVALLRDDVRRGLYLFVRRAPRPVTREEAAAHVGISHKLAAFHLDRLVAGGLLKAGPQPAEGRRRIGRAPKAYRPSDISVRIDIPPREPEALAGILADAVTNEQPGRTAWDSALDIARRRGFDLGAAEREAAGAGRLDAERAIAVAEQVLERHGYEPHRAGPELLRLRNCPFQPLSATAPALVCGINHAFLSGFAAGLGAESASAALVPRANMCCVELRSPEGAAAGTAPGPGVAGPGVAGPGVAGPGVAGAGGRDDASGPEGDGPEGDGPEGDGGPAGAAGLI
jgi:predicted ArsR family transcriptional regulator